jgi:hypothetical protein
MAIRLAGVRRLSSWIETTSRFEPRPPLDETAVRRLGTCVAIAARNTLPNTCLHRSLTLGWLLRRRGVLCKIRFGARRGPAGLEAHAWVEWNGRVQMDDGIVSDEYEPLDWPLVSGRR